MRSPHALLAVAFVLGCNDYELLPDEPEVEVPDEIPDDVETGAIRGRVCAPDGHTWVVGADVTAVHEYGQTATTTGADGWFTLEPVPVGHFTVTITKGSFSTDFDIEVLAGQVTTLPSDQCLEQGDVKIAVLTGAYDSIQVILDGLGFTYDLLDGMPGGGGLYLLSDPARLETYDIVFFNCGMSDGWLAHRTEVAANLRDYVDGGGSIYASDWSYYVVETAFPEHNTYQGDDAVAGSAYVGATGTASGNVLDLNMAATLGSSTAALNYDLPQWAAVTSTASGRILIEGNYRYYPAGAFQSRVAYGPLATRYDFGDGTVIYTSFHNEAQSTLDMTLILEEIILSL